MSYSLAQISSAHNLSSGPVHILQAGRWTALCGAKPGRTQTWHCYPQEVGRAPKDAKGACPTCRRALAAKVSADNKDSQGAAAASKPPAPEFLPWENCRTCGAEAQLIAACASPGCAETTCEYCAHNSGKCRYCLMEGEAPSHD
jgi:hypothetical protein